MSRQTPVDIEKPVLKTEPLGLSDREKETCANCGAPRWMHEPEHAGSLLCPDGWRDREP